MNLLQTIIGYYHGEARHGFLGAIIGGLLLTGSLILWKWASPLSLLKGLSVPMLLFGLLVGIGGIADGYATRKAAPERIALYQKDQSAFLKQEKVKVEKTHRGWPGLRIFWGVLGFGGLLLSLLIRKPFWIGAGLGTLALAAVISIIELYSMRFNESYYKAITAATSEQTAATEQPPIIPSVEQTEKKPRLKKRKEAISVQQTDTLPKWVAPRDSLQVTYANIVKIDTRSLVLKSDQPDSMSVTFVANVDAPVIEKKQKKKLLDYYHSDLIRADGVGAKHCWFSKKYINE